MQNDIHTHGIPYRLSIYIIIYCLACVCLSVCPCVKCEHVSINTLKFIFVGHVTFEVY